MLVAVLYAEVGADSKKQRRKQHHITGSIILVPVRL